ncbi:hypothetical protein L6452_04295 [Arctium lappa]|uniref:Uncharacterized protein n=1 Tax=Arctium lappa TaxID=4217 RepID=A0ACB9FQT6_ARCLA|nr:hypothetical protein L6452_04295 [Arctium lappa]
MFDRIKQGVIEFQKSKCTYTTVKKLVSLVGIRLFTAVVAAISPPYSVVQPHRKTDELQEPCLTAFIYFVVEEKKGCI